MVSFSCHMRLFGEFSIKHQLQWLISLWVMCRLMMSILKDRQVGGSTGGSQTQRTKNCWSALTHTTNVCTQEQKIANPKVKYSLLYGQTLKGKFTKWTSSNHLHSKFSETTWAKFQLVSTLSFFIIRWKRLTPFRSTSIPRNRQLVGLVENDHKIENLCLMSKCQDNSE